MHYLYRLIGLTLLLSIAACDETDEESITANAGQDQIVAKHESVTLDSALSELNGEEEYFYAWSIVNSPSSFQGALATNSNAKTSFTPTVSGVYLIELKIYTDKGDAYLDIVKVIVQNQGPNILKKEIQISRNVAISPIQAFQIVDGDDDLISYQFKVIAYPESEQARFVGSDFHSPTLLFSATPGNYVMEIIVTDGEAEISEQVSYEVINAAPVAVVSDDLIIDIRDTAELFALDSYDDNGDDLGFDWEVLIKPENSSPILEANDVNGMDFTPDQIGQYTIRVIVSDGFLSSEDIISITVEDLICQHNEKNVEWELLVTGVPSSLSDINLFQSQCDPTGKPNEGGFAYELVSPSFHNYASQYSYIFIPNGKKITFNENEDFEFPIGSIVAQTFSLPENTNNRKAKETLLETRLAFKRESGWILIPYIWNENQTDAVLSYTGSVINTSFIHEGSIREFNYKVPSPQQCRQCHSSADESVLIGMKSNQLNKVIKVDSMNINQLDYWQQENILQGVPEAIPDSNLVQIDESLNVDEISEDQLSTYAKSWMLANCQYCHTSDGQAGNTNFIISYDGELTSGVCSSPIAYYGQGGLVIEPGDSTNSAVYQRINAVTSADVMPMIDRSLIDEQGVLVMKRWIDNLLPTGCL